MSLENVLSLQHSTGVAALPAMCPYIFNPLSHYRRQVFSWLQSSHIAGEVLDVGCGTAGLYWALAYVDRVSSISFLDCKESSVTELEDQLEHITPSYLRDTFGDTLEFLGRSQHSFELAAALQLKCAGFLAHDITTAASEQRERFQSILAIHCLQCVNTPEELREMLYGVHAMLAPGGKLFCVSLRYPERSARMNQLIALRQEGVLNLDSEEMHQAMMEVGFSIDSCSAFEHGVPKNYSKVMLFTARKSEEVYAV